MPAPVLTTKPTLPPSPYQLKEGTDIPVIDRLLTIAEAAELLATSERFPRRLIAERRIRFVRVGRHVRIPESALREFIAVGTVEPISVRWRAGRAVV